jgi:hypothetical protein
MIGICGIKSYTTDVTFMKKNNFCSADYNQKQSFQGVSDEFVSQKTGSSLMPDRFSKKVKNIGRKFLSFASDCTYAEKMCYAEEIYKANKDTVKDIVVKDNKIKFAHNGKRKEISLDELINPCNDEIELVYHGTSAEAYNNILKNGFDLTIKPVHMKLALTGIYCALNKTDTEYYGDTVMTIKNNGKIAQSNLEILSLIKEDGLIHESIMKLFEDSKYTQSADKWFIAVEVVNCMLKDLFLERGYTGVMDYEYSEIPGCHSFIALDPASISILG